MYVAWPVCAIISSASIDHTMQLIWLIIAIIEMYIQVFSHNEM